MHTLDSLEKTRASGQWPTLLPPDAPLGHLPAIHLEPEDAGRLRQGQAVAAAGAPAAGRVRLYDEERFLGIGESDGAGRVHPRRLLRLEPYG
jgi:tRNA pseudouridine55 synthase